ncbi:MAG: hypothetical protein ACJ702_09015 [Nitrososphaeraceae archaeon]
MQYRERCGKILTEKSPLFREQFDINDLEQIKKHAKKITINAIALSLTKKLHVAGIMPIEELKEGDTPGKKRKAIARTYGFRKFVNTSFVNARLNDTIRNMLLGHSTDLDNVYYKPKPDDLLQEYLKAADSLTINEENRLHRKVQELDFVVIIYSKIDNEDNKHFGKRRSFFINQLLKQNENEILR